MEKNPLVIQIVADNALIVAGLSHFLRNRFGSALRVESSYDLKTFFGRIDSETDAVIIDYMVDGTGGNEIAKKLRGINSTAEIIMHSWHSDVARCIEALIRSRQEEYNSTSLLLEGQLN